MLDIELAGRDTAEHADARSVDGPRLIEEKGTAGQGEEEKFQQQLKKLGQQGVQQGRGG